MKLEAKARLTADKDGYKVTPPAGWEIADEATKDAFNKWGNKPDPVCMKTVTAEGYATYGLTILYDGNGNYLPAHGGVVMKNQPCKTVEQAAKIAMQWYMANRGKASKS